MRLLEQQILNFDGDGDNVFDLIEQLKETMGAKRGFREVCEDKGLAFQVCSYLSVQDIMSKFAVLTKETKRIVRAFEKIDSFWYNRIIHEWIGDGDRDGMLSHLNTDQKRIEQFGPLKWLKRYP